jgi:hypothetical protein
VRSTELTFNPSRSFQHLRRPQSFVQCHTEPFVSYRGEPLATSFRMADVGFTFENVPLKPRLGLKANVTSGDGNRNDADLQTFNPLFPRGAYFGDPALIGPANHIDVHPSLDLALTRNLTLNFNWDCFWRESTGDGIYGPSVNLIQSGQTSSASYIGNQVEAVLEWRLGRHFTVATDCAHFFAGDFLKQTTPGKDVDYFSAWITFRF